ncbi:interferon alpha/beta receptor 1a-like isoform X1 [Entelurus aequoreus]|uniref:interferon alpha/beta receptor 1a-like isoform X1 n=1 Tax=Entelurus aequoreus TaxID=161455 RepID=UPI002B1D775C|nr:interferon alpha/beta receptor 1a-like isoform X1 [Entelurus aequoreus]
MFRGYYMFLLFSVVCWLQPINGRAELSPPQNVDLDTMNTCYTLKWDWDESTSNSHAVSFSAQCIAKYKLEYKTKHTWTTACDNTSLKSCDLAVCRMHYVGVYILRVRANVNGNYSNWVLKTFCPEKHATIGPPSNVRLAPHGSNLSVYISDPLNSSNCSMTEEFSKLSYNILYWERNEDMQVLEPKILKSDESEMTLTNLKSWTFYCVKVQSRFDLYNKSSTFTLSKCIQTEGTIPLGKRIVYFLGSFSLFFLVVLLLLYVSLKCYWTVKETFYPMIHLPPFFQKDSHDSFGSDIPCLLSLGSEVFCDEVIICEKPQEFHNLPSDVLASSQEPNSSGQDSRQDVRRSEDSGVYSTEGSYSQQQSNSSYSSSGAKLSYLVDQDQEKMQNMNRIIPHVP